jgi:hypothetical protein
MNFEPAGHVMAQPVECRRDLVNRSQLMRDNDLTREDRLMAENAATTGNACPADPQLLARRAVCERDGHHMQPIAAGNGWRTEGCVRCDFNRIAPDSDFAHLTAEGLSQAAASLERWCDDRGY